MSPCPKHTGLHLTDGPSHRWSYSTYFTFKHHVAENGLNSAWASDAFADVRGWDGDSRKMLPHGWTAAMDWSTIQTRPESSHPGVNYYPFARHINWKAIGRNSTRLGLEWVSAMRQYMRDVFAVVRRIVDKHTGVSVVG